MLKLMSTKKQNNNLLVFNDTLNVHYSMTKWKFEVERVPDDFKTNANIKVMRSKCKCQE